MTTSNLVHRPLRLLFAPLAGVVLCGAVPYGHEAAPAKDQTTAPRADTHLPPADLILTNGAFYTVDDALLHAEAVAIRDGVLVYVGDLAIPPALTGPDTEVVDLGGRTVVPGLHDSHTHILEAFHPAAGTCILPPYWPLGSHVPRLSDCADDQVGTDWVLGWGFDIYDALYAFQSPRDILDDAIPDQPAAIMEQTSHSVWVNTEALNRLGIDASTPDPTGGLILREDGGDPDGMLIDAAGELAFDMALERTDVLDTLNEVALRAGIAQANENGITTVCDGRTYWKRGYVEAWKNVEAAGDLTVRAVASLWAYPDMDDDEQIATLTSMYEYDASSRLRFNQVKLYSDGLLYNTTAALLEPYEVATLGPNDGLNYFDADRITRYTTELEAVGFDMHIHAIGDRGVREALDAVASARATNGDVGARHRLTHVEWVHPDDVPRFAELDVTADFQMSYRWVEPAYLDDNHRFVGEARTNERVWRLRDLYESGANVVLSSDYDVGSMSPFDGMERAIHRGDQSLPDVDAALRAYTINAARLLRLDDLVGSITVGKRADLVVVDRDIFTTADLGNTKVLWTLLDGEEVYRSPDFTP